MKPTASESMEQQVAVVVVPFPAQGHLNQLLHLSLLLSARGLPVYYAASPTHSRQARERVHGWDPDSLETIRFPDLPVPPFAAPSPDPAADNSFPSHLLPAFEASENLRAPLADLIRTLSDTTRRVIVIEDTLMPFAGHDAASLPNTEIYGFYSIAVFNKLSNQWDGTCSLEPRLDVGTCISEPRPDVLNVILASFDEVAPKELWDFVYRRVNETSVETGYLINTCRPIEGEFIDLLAMQLRVCDNKLYAIGPLNPVVPRRDGGGDRRHDCLEWLDRQPPASVVYVSFGTTCAISDGQIEQLAAGLKGSRQRFIWVLRDADRGDIFSEELGPRTLLREEYEREVEGVGLVIRGWAPQLEILGHASTGAFMSHCGWNSCMESLSMGVPILAWPMHSDQPKNAMVVTEYLKVGVPVRTWDRRKETVSATEIEEAIKRVMVYDEGKEMRRRAKELGEAVREAVSEGGSSRTDLSSFVAHITR